MPKAGIEHTRNGCVVTVTGEAYRIRAEWSGACDERGRPKFTADLHAKGYKPQRTVFGLGAGMYPDDARTVAALALSAFAIGEGDVEDTFWNDDGICRHDPRWITWGNLDRERLHDDLEAFEGRVCA